MRNGSRFLLVLAVLVAVAGVLFLFVGNPFAPTAGHGLDAENASEASPDLARGVDAAPEAASDAPPTLAAGFQVAGTGEVAVRLLRYKDRAPIAGQAVRFSSPRGTSVERTSGEDGRVRARDLPAGSDWTLTVAVEGLAPVEMKGIAVRRGLTDLGDLLLGQRAVLHGRVIDTRGKPVAGASVSAYLGGGADWSQGIAGALVQSALSFPEPADRATSDERGEFILSSLVPGAQYELLSKKPGLAFNVQSGLVVSPERASAVLIVVLGPGATLRGRVLDETGKGVAEATVVALEDLGGMRGAAMTSLRKDFVRTKADGSYALETLSRGASYRFGVIATGIAPTFDSTGMRIDGDATRDFNVVRGGTIEGLVTDKTSGQPVADARVLAVSGAIGAGPMGGRGRRPGGGGGGAADGGVPTEQASTQMARTDGTGRFRLDGLKPGPVAIAQVRATGYADFAATTWTNNAWGDVRAGETLTANVELESGGTVTGKILGESGKGLVPVVGAQVALLSFQSLWTGYPTATTGEDGSYKVDGVRAGSQFTVTATASGFVAPAANPMDPASQMTMPAEGGVLTKDLTLTAAGSIEGRVTNSKGAPVAGARLRTRSAPQPGGRGGMGGFGGREFYRQFLPGGAAATVLSDGDGLFRIESVTSDEPLLVVAETDEHVPSESEAVTVRAGETKQVEIVLQGGATLRGRVIDERGALVSAARIRIGTLEANEEADPSLAGWRADRFLEQRVFTTDADGLFEITKVRPGRVLLRADRDGFVTYYRRDLRLGNDEVRENHVVSMTRGETIAGVVKGDDGKPVPQASVMVTRQENPLRFGGLGGAAPAPAPAPATDDGSVEPTMNDRTDDQGRFTVENVPPGTSYSVLVLFAPGYRGYNQGTETAIRRGVAPGSKDVELVVKKAAEGENPFPMGARPPGSTAGATTVPRPPGVTPTPVPPATGGR